MIPVLGCETARELLEPFLDGELSMPEQVAVQAHVRSCGVCAARMEDLSLIGWSLRAGTPALQPHAEDARAMAVVQSGVLARIRAERSQALGTRMSEMFADMRLVWPAIGATTAVIVCLCGMVNVWHLTMQRYPNSVAAMLEARANQGTDSHPLPLDTDMSVPRALDGVVPVGDLLESDALVAIVIGTSGRVTHAELPGSSVPSRYEQAMLEAVREQRFAPAQVRSGRPVAVETMVYYTQVTAVPSAFLDLLDVLNVPRPAATPRTIHSDSSKMPVTEVPAGLQSAVSFRSAIA